MQAMVPILAASLLLLAGCASDPPQGTISMTSHAITVAGGAAIDYQPFEGQNPGSGAPGVGGTVQCTHGSVPGSPLPPCRGPWTRVDANLTLPLAVDGAYSLVFVNATGEMAVGELTEASTEGNSGLYTGSFNMSQDYTGRFTTLELRLGSFLLATAPAGEGVPSFTVVPTATATVDATWSGMTISGNVTGAPTNATLRGNLYLPNATDPAESFPISADGKFSYTSKTRDINMFAEFHVHVGNSKVNLYKATIHTAE